MRFLAMLKALNTHNSSIDLPMVPKSEFPTKEMKEEIIILMLCRGITTLLNLWLSRQCQIPQITKIMATSLIDRSWGLTCCLRIYRRFSSE